MANKKISELPASSGTHLGDLVPVVDSGDNATKKATLTQIIATIPDVNSVSHGLMLAADKVKLDAGTSNATAGTVMMRDGSGNTAVSSLTAAQVTVTGTPTASTDAANKAYVDAVAVGLTIKAGCRVATTANVASLAGGAPSTLDSISLVLNDRILVKDQSTATQNGIYTVTTVGSGSNGTWTRATDADTGAELPTNSYVFVTQGTIWGSSSWVMATAGTITIGSSNIVWVLFSQIVSLPAANITGQIVAAQIADAAINTAKFAASIQPVSIVSSVPSPSGYTGPRAVFNTTDGKLYRFDGAAFVTTVPTTDLSGTITTTQITDSSISTAKLQANCVTAAKIAAGTITANEIAADTITAGQIAAGAINTSELAAGAVTAAKIFAGTITTTQIAAATILASNIAAGTITADRMNVSSLSAISANLGTITAGTISAVTINSSTINSPNGTIGGFTIGVNTLTSTAGNYSCDFRPASGGNSGQVLMTYSGATFVSLIETTAGGVLSLGKVGNTASVQLVGQTGAITGATVTTTGTITGATVVSNGTMTAASDVNVYGDIRLGTGGINRWIYDGDGNRVIQKRYSGTPVTLADAIAVLQYHGLCN